MEDVMGLKLEEALNRLKQSGIEDIKILFTLPPYENPCEYHEKRVILQKEQGKSLILVVAYF